MSRRFAGLVGFCAWLVASAAGAQSGNPVVGPNSDFPDANLVMPFDASTNHNTFFSISNVDSTQVTNTWVFYDESGQTLAQVDRDIPGNGGTDIVDPLSVRTRSIDSSGQITEGNPQSLAGLRGFVVVQGPGDNIDRLMGNFTIANLATGSAFGANATGLGAIGTIQQANFVLGTTFNPTTLQDSELIIVSLNIPNITSLTNGAAPPAGQALMIVSISLDSNSGQLASGDFSVVGSALFSSLPDLFPGTSLNSSATISATATEGPGYMNTSFDVDSDSDLGIIGWYGEAVGQFGAAQSLRTISP
jgi:hypothetical protein